LKNGQPSKQFKQPTLLVLGNRKWSLHFKLNLSFEMCELCVDKQESHCYITLEKRVKL
jgi:hypothetical protein